MQEQVKLAQISVSIHASSREDATKGPGVELPLGGFNPRVLPRGRDAAKGYITRYTVVSIHASSREDATTFCP